MIMEGRNYESLTRLEEEPNNIVELDPTKHAIIHLFVGSFGDGVFSRGTAYAMNSKAAFETAVVGPQDSGIEGMFLSDSKYFQMEGVSPSRHFKIKNPLIAQTLAVHEISSKKDSMVEALNRALNTVDKDPGLLVVTSATLSFLEKEIRALNIPVLLVDSHQIMDPITAVDPEGASPFADLAPMLGKYQTYRAFTHRLFNFLTKLAGGSGTIQDGDFRMYFSKLMQEHELYQLNNSMPTNNVVFLNRLNYSVEEELSPQLTEFLNYPGNSIAIMPRGSLPLDAIIDSMPNYLRTLGETFPDTKIVFVNPNGEEKLGKIDNLSSNVFVTGRRVALGTLLKRVDTAILSGGSGTTATRAYNPGPTTFVAGLSEQMKNINALGEIFSRYGIPIESISYRDLTHAVQNENLDVITKTLDMINKVNLAGIKDLQKDIQPASYQNILHGLEQLGIHIVKRT